MSSEKLVVDICEFSTQLRRDALALLYFAESGHPGGVLSCADIVATLWLSELSYGTTGRLLPDRNRLVLSKGHSVAAVYAAAGLSGLVDPEWATCMRNIDSPLQGHPHVGDTPWVETSTGSLGQGFSCSIGMALGLQHQGIDALVFVVLGDGELQEGQVWEGAMSAAHYELGNLCAVVDCNGLQSDDTTESIMGIHPVADKWRSFGWDVHEVDGHDITELLGALAATKRAGAQPSVLLADTVKGKGVSFMEGVPEWHGSVKISTGEFRRALEELGASEDEIKRYVEGRFWNS